MKKLILIRHAKSSWSVAAPDCDRNLSTKGISDAHVVSEILYPLLPESFIIWSSSAKRTRETATIFVQNFSIALEAVVLKRELYTFDASELESIVKKCENQHQNLILFGHNDAITNFVDKFGDLSIAKVPTSGVVIIEFEQDDWKRIEKGKIVQTIFPRDLQV